MNQIFIQEEEENAIDYFVAYLLPHLECEVRNVKQWVSQGLENVKELNRMLRRN